MVTLALYALLAIGLMGGLFLLAVRVLPSGEQIAPSVRDEPIWTLPEELEVTASDVAHVRLPVALRGYRFAETDVLLDRLAEEIRRRDELIVQLSGRRSGAAAAEGPALSQLGDFVTDMDDDDEVPASGAVSVVEDDGQAEPGGWVPPEVQGQESWAAPLPPTPPGEQKPRWWQRLKATQPAESPVTPADANATSPWAAQDVVGPDLGQSSVQPPGWWRVPAAAADPHQTAELGATPEELEADVAAAEIAPAADVSTAPPEEPDTAALPVWGVIAPSGPPPTAEAPTAWWGRPPPPPAPSATPFGLAPPEDPRVMGEDKPKRRWLRRSSNAMMSPGPDVAGSPDVVGNTVGTGAAFVEVPADEPAEAPTVETTPETGTVDSGDLTSPPDLPVAAAEPGAEVVAADAAGNASSGVAADVAPQQSPVVPQRRGGRRRRAPGTPPPAQLREQVTSWWPAPGTPHPDEPRAGRELIAGRTPERSVPESSVPEIAVPEIAVPESSVPEPAVLEDDQRPEVAPRVRRRRRVDNLADTPALPQPDGDEAVAGLESAPTDETTQHQPRARRARRTEPASEAAPSDAPAATPAAAMPTDAVPADSMPTDAVPTVDDQVTDALPVADIVPATEVAQPGAESAEPVRPRRRRRATASAGPPADVPPTEPVAPGPQANVVPEGAAAPATDAERNVAEQSVAEQSVAEQSVAEQSVAEQSVAEQSAADPNVAPVADDRPGPPVELPVDALGAVVIPVEPAPPRPVRRRGRRRAEDVAEHEDLVAQPGAAVDEPTIPIQVALAGALDETAAADEGSVADGAGASATPDSEPPRTPEAATSPAPEDDDPDADWWRGGPEVTAEIEQGPHEQEGRPRRWWRRRLADVQAGDPFVNADQGRLPVIPVEAPSGWSEAADAVVDEPSAAAQPEVAQAEPDGAVAETVDVARPDVAEPDVAAGQEDVAEGDEETEPARDVTTAVADWQPPADFTFPGQAKRHR